MDLTLVLAGMAGGVLAVLFLGAASRLAHWCLVDTDHEPLLP